MLVCETAGTELQDIEDLAVLVSQLVALGVDARVHVAALPAELPRNAQFDLAPHLFDDAPAPDDRIVLVAAQRLGDERLLSLRHLAGDLPRRVTAIGTFANRQSVIGTQAKLSYVFGADPEIIDLGAASSREAGMRNGLPVFGVPVRRQRKRPGLLVVAPNLNDPAEARALQALALSSRFDLAILTDGSRKRAWIESHGLAIPVFHFGEVLPVALAQRVDICAAFSALPTSYRGQSLFAHLLVSGAALLDGTAGHRLAAECESWIPAPPDIASLGAFLEDRILPNLGVIAAQRGGSSATARLSPAPLLERLGAVPVQAAPPRPAPQKRPDMEMARPVVFMPTNGIGLGHAQRCSQIARELDRERAEPVFAAFPGCMGLVKSRGFDVMPLVSRSPAHARTYQNDLVNYLRLRALAKDAGALVFDGGYVFDSVYRTVLETGVPGVWIRRGLWQAGQDNTVALDREKAFTRVIVPGEAFPELERNYSRGGHLHAVGPIVPPRHAGSEARASMRARLAEHFDRPFERLVVSLLGAGVAADRSAQIQTLAGMMERRPDVLHLVVVWPASVLQPGWFGWSNTRIVKTYHAGLLAGAADLLVAAAGYNTFLEVLYNRLPTIFIPQMGHFMDDQRARAQAAAERGLAAHVEPSELVLLDRLVERYLAGGEAEVVRARLAAAELPAPGNADAARLIEEVIA